MSSYGFAQTVVTSESLKKLPAPELASATTALSRELRAVFVEWSQKDMAARAALYMQREQPRQNPTALAKVKQEAADKKDSLDQEYQKRALPLIQQADFVRAELLARSIPLQDEEKAASDRLFAEIQKPSFSPNVATLVADHLLSLLKRVR